MLTGYSGVERGFFGLVMVAAAWAALTPLMVLLPIFEAPVGAAETAGAPTVSAADAGRLGEALAVLVPASAAGLIGGLGLRRVSRRQPWGRGFLAVAAGVLLLLTVLTAGSIGKVFFPPAILFALATLWLPPPA